MLYWPLKQLESEVYVEGITCYDSASNILAKLYCIYLLLLQKDPLIWAWNVVKLGSFSHHKDFLCYS